MPWTDPKTWSVSEVVTAANMNTHVRDNEKALDRGNHLTKFKVVGTGGGFGERWHLANPFSNASTATALSLSIFYATPLLVPAGTLDRIAFLVTGSGGAGGVARVGIYQATSDTDPYPNALLLDCGENSTNVTNTRVVSTISAVLAPQTLYWAAVVCGVGAPTIRTDTTSTLPGWTDNSASSISTAQFGFSKAQTYGVLPATFPTGSPTIGINAPSFVVRYSA